MDAYGYDKSKLYTLSEKHIYVDYFNDAIVLTLVSISGTAICDGIIEIINERSISNKMYECTEKNVISPLCILNKNQVWQFEGTQ